eukprot:7467929-Lingulodinium_polyedra.AAC.1
MAVGKVDAKVFAAGKTSDRHAVVAPVAFAHYCMRGEGPGQFRLAGGRCDVSSGWRAQVWF